MRKFGFKVFNNNLTNMPTLIHEFATYAQDKSDMFIELMVTPQCSNDDLQYLKQLFGNVETRIHAAHSSMGFDVGNRDLEKRNRQIMALAQTAADMFNSPTIVVHGGCGKGEKTITETIRQFKLFNDSRIVVENLPCPGYLCGNTATEIQNIMQETGCGFCFDFSHAICAALEMNIDIEKQLRDFFKLHPNVYHLCDGKIDTANDMHLHFGDGTYPLQHFLRDYTAKDAYITMETGPEPMPHSDVYVRDYNYLKALEQ